MDFMDTTHVAQGDLSTNESDSDQKSPECVPAPEAPHGAASSAGQAAPVDSGALLPSDAVAGTTPPHVGPIDQRAPALISLIAEQFASQAGKTLQSGVLSQIGRKALQFTSLAELDTRVTGIFEFLGGVEGFSQKTLAGLRTDYRSFRQFLETSSLAMSFLCGDLEVQKRVIESYISTLRAARMAHETVATYFRGLRSTFEWLGKRFGTLNPFACLTRPRGSPGLPKAIRAEALEQVLRFLLNRQTPTDLERLRDLAIVALLGLAGLRRGEVLRLEVQDIDVSTGAILIRRGKARHGGRDRLAQLTSQGRDIVRAYADARKRARRSHPEFITSIAGDTRIGEVTIRRLFRRIGTATGQHIAPHMLRHTFATLLDKRGASSHVRMLVLGHQSLEVLQRYTHSFTGDVQQEVDRLVLEVDTSRLARVLPSLTKPQPRDAAPPVVVKDAEVTGGGDEAGVAGEGLDHVQRDVAADHHRHEGVAQRVDAEGDARGSADRSDDADQGGGGHPQSPGAPGEEARSDDPGTGSLPKVRLQQGAELRTDVCHPVLPAPLALPPPHKEGFLGEVYIREGEVQEFTLPDPAVDQRPEDRNRPGPLE